MAESLKADALENKESLTGQDGVETEDNSPKPEKKGLRKLTKTRAERDAEIAALSELETADYVPQEHDREYDVTVDRAQYKSNYAMGAALILIGLVFIPYSKTACALLAFYGGGVLWTTYKNLKIKIHVNGTNFTLQGNKFAGEYSFDEVDKMIYTYNRREQRRYWIYARGERICEIAPGSINGRFLYDDMMAYGVEGGLHQAL